ncbi:MAG: histidinol-phosphate transaminase [Firmicutes bacterium]|nr:histidinol-phosphate transaminase [Bacillota bacterium]
MIRKCLDNIRPYSPGKPIDEVKRELGLTEVYKLASNENPLGPPESAVEAMKLAAGKVSLYPDADAYELRTALAKYHNVQPNQIVFGDGSNELLKLLSLVFLEPGDEIIMPKPSFGEYVRCARLCGAEAKAIPLTEDYVVDLPAMVGAISSKTKIVYICNPNNPTGTVVDKRLLKQMMHRMNDVIVVLDEAYFEFVSDENSPDGVEFFKEFPNVVALRTFSKAYGLAGLRVGYGICNEYIAAAINKVREPFNVNSLAQVAAIAALNDAEYLKKSVEYNAIEREFLYTELKKRGFQVVPSQTNFMLFDVVRDCVDVFKGLLQKGIITRSADIFGYPTKIRLSVGLRSENEAFLKALDEYMGL